MAKIGMMVCGHCNDRPPYPHADHPTGPESVRRRMKARA